MYDLNVLMFLSMYTYDADIGLMMQSRPHAHIQSRHTLHTRAVFNDKYTFICGTLIRSLALNRTQGQDGTYRKLVKPLKTPSGTLVSWLELR